MELLGEQDFEAVVRAIDRIRKECYGYGPINPSERSVVRDQLREGRRPVRVNFFNFSEALLRANLDEG